MEPLEILKTAVVTDICTITGLERGIDTQDFAFEVESKFLHDGFNGMKMCNQIMRDSLIMQPMAQHETEYMCNHSIDLIRLGKAYLTAKYINQYVQAAFFSIKQFPLSFRKAFAVEVGNTPDPLIGDGSSVFQVLLFYNCLYSVREKMGVIFLTNIIKRMQDKLLPAVAGASLHERDFALCVLQTFGLPARQMFNDVCMTIAAAVRKPYKANEVERGKYLISKGMEKFNGTELLTDSNIATFVRDYLHGKSLLIVEEDTRSVFYVLCSVFHSYWNPPGRVGKALTTSWVEPIMRSLHITKLINDLSRSGSQSHPQSPDANSARSRPVTPSSSHYAATDDPYYRHSLQLKSPRAVAEGGIDSARKTSPPSSHRAGFEPVVQRSPPGSARNSYRETSPVFQSSHQGTDRSLYSPHQDPTPSSGSALPTGRFVREKIDKLKTPSPLRSVTRDEVLEKLRNSPEPREATAHHVSDSLRETIAQLRTPSPLRSIPRDEALEQLNRYSGEEEAHHGVVEKPLDSRRDQLRTEKTIQQRPESYLDDSRQPHTPLFTSLTYVRPTYMDGETPQASSIYPGQDIYKERTSHRSTEGSIAVDPPFYEKGFLDIPPQLLEPASIKDEHTYEGWWKQPIVPSTTEQPDLFGQFLSRARSASPMVVLGGGQYMSSSPSGGAESRNIFGGSLVAFSDKYANPTFDIGSSDPVPAGPIMDHPTSPYRVPPPLSPRQASLSPKPIRLSPLVSEYFAPGSPASGRSPPSLFDSSLKVSRVSTGRSAMMSPPPAVSHNVVTATLVDLDGDLTARSAGSTKLQQPVRTPRTLARLESPRHDKVPSVQKTRDLVYQSLTKSGMSPERSQQLTSQIMDDGYTGSPRGALTESITRLEGIVTRAETSVRDGEKLREIKAMMSEIRDLANAR